MKKVSAVLIALALALGVGAILLLGPGLVGLAAIGRKFRR